MAKLRSKKFTAYLISELGWKILILVLIWEYGQKIDHYAFIVLLTMIVTSGFIQIGYILGQAALDKYTAVAQTALERDKVLATQSTKKESNSDDFEGA
jgi:hypothetical protein